MPGSVASIDSSSSSSDSYDLDEQANLAQQEWEQSLQDISHLVSAVLLPYIGKYFGRSFSYWGLHTLLRNIFRLLISHCHFYQLLVDIFGWVLGRLSFGVGHD
jgi:Mitochondrial import 2